MSARQSYFSAATFDFLRSLSRNNRKDWFDAHKADYERNVRAPALAFIEAARPRLAKISREIVADPRPVGGSLMRVYRDIRFSKDKTPYKTNVGISFGHRKGRDAAAPGYYLHLSPDPESGCFSGGGIHMADGKTLGAIRDAIVREPAAWRNAAHNARLRSGHEFGGDALKKPPQGYPAEHPLIDDLKRKSFFCHVSYTPAQVTSPEFLDRFIDNCKIESPLLAFLSRSVSVAW
jgi:uncharacterized protein (TIGR02453 family)